MKNYSHNCIVGLSGLLCANHGIDFMQIITFCWMFAAKEWGGEGGVVKRKSNTVKEKNLLLLEPLLQCPAAEPHAHCLLKDGGLFRPLFFFPSRVAPERLLPNRAFYAPVLVGTELFEGRRKEDCGCTFGIKLNLVFVEKQLMSTAMAECDRDFLAEKNPLVYLPVGLGWYLSRRDDACLQSFFFFF